MMNLRQLTYFVRIFELRNMTRAAESLHVVQPALSHQIAQLESSVGAELFVRNSKGMEPTAKGKILYRQVTTILRELNAIPNMLSREENLIGGTVSVGMPSSAARMLAVPLIRATRERYPAIDLEIVDMPSADLTLMVQQGRVDISLSPDQEEVSSLSITPLIVEELLVLAHPSVQLPADNLTMTDLVNVPLILARPPNKLRMRVDYAFMSARLEYKLLAQVSTSAIALPVIREELAAAILPYSAAYREIHAGTIKYYHLAPLISREISLCTSRTAMNHPARFAIMTLIQSLTKKLITGGIWKYCRAA